MPFRWLPKTFKFNTGKCFKTNKTSRIVTQPSFVGIFLGFSGLVYNIVYLSFWACRIGHNKTLIQILCGHKNM